MDDIELSFNIIKSNTADLASPKQFSLYTVIIVEKGQGVYHADYNKFPFEGPVMLFSTPFQQIYIETDQPFEIVMIQSLSALRFNECSNWL